MPRGAFRQVFLVGAFAVKIPPAAKFKSVDFAAIAGSAKCGITGDPSWAGIIFCPIVFADPIGLVVVMPRATAARHLRRCGRRHTGSLSRHDIRDQTSRLWAPRQPRFRARLRASLCRFGSGTPHLLSKQGTAMAEQFRHKHGGLTSLNADVPHAWADAPRSGPPVS